jgi:hypothetical protein
MDDPPGDPVLEALWRRTLEAWPDVRGHAALLDHAVRTGSLPELAGRYRALIDDPARGALARERLDAIVAAALTMLEATKAPPPARVPLPITLSAFGICAVILGWLAWAIWGHP